MTDDEGRRPIERPVTTAEQVVEAIRAGARTTDEIVARTRLNPSVVGIQLTRLTRNGVVTRSREVRPYEPGRRGQAPWVYRLPDQTDREA